MKVRALGSAPKYSKRISAVLYPRVFAPKKTGARHISAPAFFQPSDRPLQTWKQVANVEDVVYTSPDVEEKGRNEEEQNRMSILGN